MRARLDRLSTTWTSSSTRYSDDAELGRSLGSGYARTAAVAASGLERRVEQRDGARHSGQDWLPRSHGSMPGVGATAWGGGSGMRKKWDFPPHH
jgi:hypothetical protein